MKRIFLSALFALLMIGARAQTASSPQQFLGYELGKEFTPHYKIVNYFIQLGKQRPDMVKVEPYGKTYEGRELMVVIIASAKNMTNLDNIRKQNLGLTKGENSGANTGIVWLSYNVHGNEPSSSEAAMMTAFALVDADNKKTKQWLENTVVIIDPCLNPDGRDRYVNWYNSVKGKQYNVDPQSREHTEPWPGGRSNHYNFDLNRDWAWQTQIETRQRVKKYNEWMPHVHVDFHEQYYNDPYYFAPAAEPFHSVITPWQRELQTLIGKNHARYFDEKSWLYFTRQEFDLFYPSYGDTYPTYNGSVGMTYEQGGHSRGGLGVITANRDTLTLVDRVMHHYTTGLSTIEVASKQNARTITEFKKFFDESRSGAASEYKTYLITSNSKQKLQALKELLALNEIEFGSVSLPKNLRGYNYFTDKEESVSTDVYTIAVSAMQSKSVLAKVLLEPRGNLSDSVTYDITAWSLPYVHGIKAFGLKQELQVTRQSEVAARETLQPNAYGYLKEWTSFEDARILASLLRQGVKVRISEKEITTGNKTFARGTLIILKQNNIQLEVILRNITDSLNAKFDVIQSGFVDKGADIGSPDVKMLKAPRVAMFTGPEVSSLSAGEIWHYFEEQLNYPLTILNVNDYFGISLSNYDVVILPNGSYSFLGDKTISEKISQFVKQGGKLIALQGAVNQLGNISSNLKSIIVADAEERSDSIDYNKLRKYADRVRSSVVENISGAIYKVEMDNTHPMAYGFPDYYFTMKQSADAYAFLKSGWNVGYIKKTNLTAGFVGNTLKRKLKDGTLIGEIEEGGGTVVFFADDPLFRAFWESGKLLFANAIFFVK